MRGSIRLAPPCRCVPVHSTVRFHNIPNDGKLSPIRIHRQGRSMSLLEQINRKRREIKTDGYPMSIGEWVSMYERHELDIHPEFQRFYRWTSAQKAALI